jgi:hypothetical protein
MPVGIGSEWSTWVGQGYRKEGIRSKYEVSELQHVSGAGNLKNCSLEV